MQADPHGPYRHYNYHCYHRHYRHGGRGGRFLVGLLFGAAASYVYLNNHSVDYDRRPRYTFREEFKELPEKKNYLLESEDYKVIFDLIKKNPPGAKETESK